MEYKKWGFETTLGEFFDKSYTRNNANLSGLEHLIMLKGLGLKSRACH